MFPHEPQEFQSLLPEFGKRRLQQHFGQQSKSLSGSKIFHKSYSRVLDFRIEPYHQKCTSFFSKFDGLHDAQFAKSEQ